MRPLPAAAAACILIACVGLLVAHTVLPHARAGNMELESAGDLIREAQHMKVMSRVLEHRFVKAAHELPVVHSEATQLGLAAHGLADEIGAERRTLARARAVIARESHMENVEGHDVQREEANTRALVHLIQRNSMARRHEQPRLQRASVELRSERRRFNGVQRAALQTAAVESKDEKKFRHDSVKLGDVETRVAHEAVPNPHDVKLLSHLTADLKRDSRLLAIDRSAAARARARETHVTLKDDSALLRHEARVQRLEKRVDVRDREDAQAQATLHRVLSHLVRHRHRLAAIQHRLARDRAAAADAERKLGQALSVQPAIAMSYKQTKLKQHQLASTIDNFGPQEGEVHAAAVAASAAAAHVRQSDLQRAERIDAQAGLALDYMQRHAE